MSCAHYSGFPIHPTTAPPQIIGESLHCKTGCPTKHSGIPSLRCRTISSPSFTLRVFHHDHQWRPQTRRHGIPLHPTAEISQHTHCCTGRITAALAVSLLHRPYHCCTHHITAALTISLLHWPYHCCTGRITAALAVSPLQWPYHCCTGRITAALAISPILTISLLHSPCDFTARKTQTVKSPSVLVPVTEINQMEHSSTADLRLGRLRSC
jgi:hypothetical protein